MNETNNLDQQFEVVAIAMKNGYSTLVDVEDYELVRRYQWRAQIDDGRVYALAYDSENRRHLKLHRLVMNAQPGERIDHRDGDGMHNWKGNLRRATNAQNIRNAPRSGGPVRRCQNSRA